MGGNQLKFILVLFMSTLYYFAYIGKSIHIKSKFDFIAVGVLLIALGNYFIFFGIKTHGLWRIKKFGN
jgi:hypothetical protein